MTKKIKVILVDDHAVVRAGYKILLTNIENISVVAETNTGEDAIILSNKHQPDVVVMDLSLPGMSGIDAIRRIVRDNNNISFSNISAWMLIWSFFYSTCYNDSYMNISMHIICFNCFDNIFF